MKKDEITSIAQLLSSMKDAVNKLKNAQIEKDGEVIAIAKKEILVFQKKIEDLL